MDELSLKRIKARVASSVKANLSFSLCELADERELMRTKWFGYRFMSPEAATATFARLYVKHLQYSVQKTRDRNMKVKDINWLSFNQGGEAFVVCWRARKRADLFCIPYEAYLTFAFDFASRRKRRFAPQINQLHGGEKSREAWLVLFDEFLREQTWPALCRLEMPQYHAEHFIGLQPQCDYRDFVLGVSSDSALVTDHWKRVIERFSYVRNEIPVEVFGRSLDAELLQECVEGLEYEVAQKRLTRAPAPAMNKDERWPSCFGLPGCQDASSICGTCPLSANCEKVAGLVRAKVVKKTGYPDPMREMKLARQNARQAKSRAGRKDGRAGTLVPESETHASSPE
ncbi:hypothetical protein [Rhizobium sp. TRM95796]|uniref:hypothetical protein n=1 Tax=Rhizobium sp. TRM95796 TaxID=2979862 RepID=UPI0021E87310|nr:hypothetical protein [Rhizobium sp. TRM95796]MCV3766181.1 hypothetical protein [Rhizobium sp. TRM95796]